MIECVCRSWCSFEERDLLLFKNENSIETLMAPLVFPTNMFNSKTLVCVISRNQKLIVFVNNNCSANATI